MRNLVFLIQQICISLPLLMSGWLVPAAAQMISLEAPFQTVNDGFYEVQSIGWNYQNGNFFFHVPGGNVNPPFGGFDPNSGANLGFGLHGPGGGRFGINLTMAQGSNRTQNVTSPSLVIPNGGFGFINNTINRPFVTSFVPVVNNGFVVPVVSPLQERIARMATEPAAFAAEDASRVDSASRTTPSHSASRRPSSAEYGDVSLREIHTAQAVEAAQALTELQVKLDKAQQYEHDGKLKLARYYYTSAWRQSDIVGRAKIKLELDRVTRSIEAADLAKRTASQSELD